MDEWQRAGDLAPMGLAAAMSARTAQHGERQAARGASWRPYGEELLQKFATL